MLHGHATWPMYIIYIFSTFIIIRSAIELKRNGQGACHENLRGSEGFHRVAHIMTIF